MKIATTLYLIPFGFLLLFAISCEEPAITPDEPTIYFPPKLGSTWETVTPQELGWKVEHIAELKDFLQNSNTRAFLVLKDGKIVMEEYYNKTLLGTDFTQDSYWYWASAGKTLTAFTVGLAQEKGHLSINNPTSQYLGAGWTILSPSQENLITVAHQITMTTGLDDGVAVNDCTLPACLRQKAAPGIRWAYHNAPYTLLDKVVEGATKQTFDQFFNNNLRDKIGLDGFWQYIDFNHVFFSTPRSMARFGLLVLNKGKWDTEAVLGDQEFIEKMIAPSQNLNKAYGYLWWLNGSDTYMVPTLQNVFNGSITPNAPADMVAAMGKNSQLLNIVPSQNLIIVRMGDNPETSLVPFTYQDQLWAKLNKVIQ